MFDVKRTGFSLHWPISGQHFYTSGTCRHTHWGKYNSQVSFFKGNQVNK